MQISGLALSDVQDVLSDVLDERVRGIEVHPLEESSRERPWRLELELGAGTRQVLLRVGKGCSRNEAVALRFMQTQEIPAPAVLLWDESGDRLGQPVFISEFIDGDPLLPAMKAQESWALDLSIKTALRLQSIQRSAVP